MDTQSFLINRETAINYLNTRDTLFVVDAFAGWDKKHQIKIRLIAERAYHAFFMHNMLIKPTPEELENFGKPDYVIFNAGKFPSNRYSTCMTSSTSIDFSFERQEIVILGTQYAGEMKKGIFSIMYYLMALKNILTLHSSANVSNDGQNVAIFFGLSGTGKTTLSADPNRKLIGDDEHCWSDDGIFNIEGGCYAKCINLDPKQEPDIFNAIRFGALLENVRINPSTREVNYSDISITANTRAAYPIEFINNSIVPCISNHPNNIIFLTCDAFGALPLVCKLSLQQSMYHFISGYTAKTEGTEQGITEPIATFSACFGEPFLTCHPFVYAKMLYEKIQKHNTNVWLINTGWILGKYGEQHSKRCPLSLTRRIISDIHSGEMLKIWTDNNEKWKKLPIFGLEYLAKHYSEDLYKCLDPVFGCSDNIQYTNELIKLSHMFHNNFKKYIDINTTQFTINDIDFIESGGPNKIDLL
jgi:phosphoenolpyruvate carboxykinase (ATP)